MSVTLNELKMKNGLRGFVIGQSGSGKTVLCQHIIPFEKSCLIIDPKGEFPVPPGYKVIKHPLKFRPSKREPFHVVYRPTSQLYDNLNAYNYLYGKIFHRENCFCYTDEVLPTISDAGKATFYLKRCYQIGRSRGIGMLSSTQRPSSIPKILFTESTKFYRFRLNDLADNIRMNQITGSKTLVPHGHQFVYYDSMKEVSPQLCELKMT